MRKSIRNRKWLNWLNETADARWARRRGKLSKKPKERKKSVHEKLL